MDAAGNLSGFSPVLSATTSNVSVTHTVRVTNSSNGNKTMTVTVVDGAGHFYTTSGTIVPNQSYSISNKGTNYLVWTLPAGTFTVTAKYGATTKQQAADLTTIDQLLSFAF